MNRQKLWGILLAVAILAANTGTVQAIAPDDNVKAEMALAESTAQQRILADMEEIKLKNAERARNRQIAAAYVSPLKSLDPYLSDKQLIVNGQKLDLPVLQVNGCILVPARAVVDVLHFKVELTDPGRGLLYYTLTGDEMKMNVEIPKDSYMAVSTVGIGATAPVKLGFSPMLVHNKLYVPAEVFRLLQGNDPHAVIISDKAVSINKVS